MLFRQELGWRHQCGLESRFDRIDGREGGDNGLSGTDVALHEAQHWMSDAKVRALARSCRTSSRSGWVAASGMTSG